MRFEEVTPRSHAVDIGRLRMISTSLEYWETLILVPFVVSIVANLCTPFSRRIIVAFVASAVKGGNKALYGMVLLRIRQIESEVNEVEKFICEPLEILKHYRSTLCTVNFGLWTLLLSPIIAACVQQLAIKYGYYLPGQVGKFLSIPGVVFALTIGALFSAGPFQTAMYSLYISRRLKKNRRKPFGIH